jgi:hypothetical protein
METSMGGFARGGLIVATTTAAVLAAQVLTGSAAAQSKGPVEPDSALTTTLKKIGKDAEAETERLRAASKILEDKRKALEAEARIEAKSDVAIDNECGKEVVAVRNTNIEAFKAGVGEYLAFRKANNQPQIGNLTGRAQK